MGTSSSDGAINKKVRKVATASFIGTAIEWYDFFIYNVATPVFFAKVFFPEDDATTAALKSFALYAVGFAARPFGGVICGHFGDRRGRRFMLIYTLLISGIATFLIGLLPGYKDIGVWAPTLLVALRLAQGFAIGGEWGGAVLMVVEHAAERPSTNRWRGFYASWPQVGVPVGLFLANAVFLLIPKPAQGEMPDRLWRVPFLLSFVLVAVGIYIRQRIIDPALFAKLTQKSKVPILDAFNLHRRDALLAMGAKVLENGVFYFYTVFTLLVTTDKILRTYTDRPINTQTMLYAIMAAALLLIATIPAFGALSDRVGRKWVYVPGAVFAGAFAFPSLWMIGTATTPLVVAAVICMLSLGWGAMYGPQASFFAELFGTKVRYSGASFGGQFATIFAGGLTLFIAQPLAKWAGSFWPISLMIVLMTIVTTASVLLAPETFSRKIGDEQGVPAEQELSPELTLAGV